LFPDPVPEPTGRSRGVVGLRFYTGAAPQRIPVNPGTDMRLHQHTPQVVFGARHTQVVETGNVL